MSDCGGYDDFASLAEFYDHLQYHQERPDVAFFVEVAREKGGPVLELGCGTGRVLIPTARAGLEIVGLDASSAMLGRCRENIFREPDDVRSRVTLHHADMSDFALDGSFRLITTPFRSFQHLTTVERQRSCLDCVRRHLAPGGTFILDVFNPSLDALTSDDLGQEVEEEGSEFSMPDGRTIRRAFRVAATDRFNQVNRIELIYHVTHPDGTKERQVHAFPMRYLFRFEAEHLLARSGFELQSVLGGYDGSPYGSEYPGELILVARRSE